MRDSKSDRMLPALIVVLFVIPFLIRILCLGFLGFLFGMMVGYPGTGTMVGFIAGILTLGRMK